MKKERLIIDKGSLKNNGIQVFESLQLQLYEGEIIGVFFDSVIERKEFHKLLTGKSNLETGEIYLNSVNVELGISDKIFEKQIKLIDNTSMLVETLSILENIFLFVDKRKFIFRNTYLEKCTKLLKTLAINMNVSKPVKELSVKERVIIEIIKAYIEEKQVVVLSGVAEFLKRNELEDIYILIEKLCTRKMSYIIIESLEDIVFEKTERLFIIQHGRTTGIVDHEFVNKEKLLKSLMNTKNEASQEINSRSKIEAESSLIMEWRAVSTSRIDNLTFDIEKGEILKIFYLDDDSCEAVLGVLSGSEKLTSGMIKLNGRAYSAKNIEQAMKKGVGFVGESPYKGMLFYDMSVRDNLNVALAQKSAWIWAKRNYIKSVNLQISEYLGKEISSTRLRRLKPEVLQRIAYFRWLLYHPKVLVILKPFVESDIHIREVTLEMIHKLQETGIAIIILTQSSSELSTFEGENLYIRNGRSIDENEVYQTLYGINDEK